MTRTHGIKWAVAGVAALSLLATACGGSDSATDDTTGGKDLKGTIFVTGSSTVEPISSLVGESFNGENSGVDITVEGPGTGDGFKKFCAGEADVANASRTIKDEEKELCASGGVEFVELAVANDALSVITNSKNTAVKCLNFADLYGLMGPESDNVSTWAGAKELGATTELPDAPFKIFAPGQESGTYDSFWELAIKKTAEEKLGKEKAEEKKLRTFGGLADDNEIIRGIQSSDTSFGWVGFAFADQADVAKIKVDGGEGCVEPSAATVADGTYPLARTLYIYVNKAKAQESEALQAFVSYYLENGAEFVEEADYVQLPEADATAATKAWEQFLAGDSADATTTTAG